MKSTPLTVLCIDDDDDDSQLFRDAIATIDTSCICLTVSCATDGLRLLENAIPDVIFLDINMPVIDGRETLINIRKIKALAMVPVYMLSTCIETEDVSNFKGIGATDCLVKPTSFSALHMILEDVLKKFRRNGAIL